MAQLPDDALTQILKGVNAPATPQNLQYMRAWQQAEGGSASFNPFNTTQPASGATNYNSVGVRNYTGLQQGIDATVQTLLNGHYGDILGSLRASADPMKTAAALAASPWGTGSLVEKILGSGGAPPVQPQPASGAPASRQLQAAGIGTMPQQQGQGGGAGLIQQLAAKLLTQQAPQITPVGQVAQHTGQPSGIVQLQQPQNAGNGILQMAMSRLQAQATHDTFGATPSAQTPVNGPAPQGAQHGIVKTAMSQIGIPYQWGGQAVLGHHTDCSGLAQAVYHANGIDIPRTTYDQWKTGTPVKPGDLQPGDLVFFHMGSQGPNHVGIYKGAGQFIEDPHTGASVKTMALATYPGFVGARRYTK